MQAPVAPPDWLADDVQPEQKPPLEGQPQIYGGQRTLNQLAAAHMTRMANADQDDAEYEPWDDVEETEDTWACNLSRGHLSRFAHTCLLAQPGFRYLVRIPSKLIPSSNLVEPVWPVNPAALKASVGWRRQDLFDLWPRPRRPARERPRLPFDIGRGPFSGGHWATRGALTVYPSRRIMHLAVPRRWYLEQTKEGYYDNLKFRNRKSLDYWLDASHKTVYAQRPKTPEPLPSPPWVRGYVWPKPPRQGPPDKAAMETMALPRREFLPDEGVPRKKKNLDDIMSHVSALAIPPKRYRQKKVNYEAMFKVRPGAMQYNISDRVLELSQPRPAPESQWKEPGVVPPGALTYEASDRVKELAQHRERPKPDEDVKEEPFAVVPAALKAVCSARTTELAQPVERGKKA